MLVSELIYNSLTSSKHSGIVSFLPRGGDYPPVSFSPSMLHCLAVTRAAELSETLPAPELPVLIAMEAGLEFVVTMVACLYAGITIVPVPVPKAKNDEQRIRAIAEDARANSILVTRRSLNLLEKLSFENDFPTPYLVSSLDQSLGKLAKPNTPPNFIRQKESIAVIQYTSGSTSNPKGVQITNENIVANHRLVENKWQFGPDKNFLNWLPHFHDMGLFGGIFYPLMSGMKLYFMSPEDFIKKPIRWLNAISQYNIHCSGGPPFSYQLCLNAVKEPSFTRPNWDLSCWKVAFCGADYVPKDLLADFRHQFADTGLSRESVLACYGLAESTLFVAGERDWSLPHPFPLEMENLSTSSEGCLLDEPGYQDRLCIFDESGNTIASNGNVGEILISGDSVSSSYIAKPLNELFIREKRWVRTGDIGFISNQRLYITGRIKNLIVSNGRNIYQDDILQAIRQLELALNTFAALILQPSILESKFVLLIERERKGEICTTSGQSDEIVRKIKTFVNAEFGLFLSDIKILKRGKLPRTTSGKIQRTAALSMYQQSLFN